MGALPYEERDPSPSAQRDSAASPLLKSGIDFFGVIYGSEHSLLLYHPEPSLVNREGAGDYPYLFSWVVGQSHWPSL